MEATQNFPKLLNQKEVARLIGKSEAWLERSRWSGIGGPPYRKIGRSVRYDFQDLLEWLKAQPRIPEEKGEKTT